MFSCGLSFIVCLDFGKVVEKIIGTKIKKKVKWSTLSKALFDELPLFFDELKGVNQILTFFFVFFANLK